MLYIFEQYGGRSFLGYDSGDFKKQESSLIPEPLAFADDGEWLAREARVKQIMIGNIIGAHGNNVTEGLDVEIAFIYGPAIRVNITSEHAFYAEGRRAK